MLEGTLGHLLQLPLPSSYPVLSKFLIKDLTFSLPKIFFCCCSFACFVLFFFKLLYYTGDLSHFQKVEGSPVLQIILLAKVSAIHSSTQP